MSLFAGSPINNLGGVVVYREEFIASEGQKIFSMNSAYEKNANRLKVYVGGTSQFSPTNFTETSSNSFTLVEGVSAGTKVVGEILK